MKILFRSQAVKVVLENVVIVMCHFYGLNLHYLPPVLRAKALDALLGEGELPMKFIKPTIHRYLTKHVKSRFALVDKPEWEIATFLPTQDFRKASSGTVYRDSRGKM